MVHPRLYRVDSDGNSHPVRFPNAVQVQSGEQWERLIITTSGSALDLMLLLLSDHPGPFRILFILIVGRGAMEPGRYALDQVLERWQLQSLLAAHGELFEQDGRHHVWICTEDNEVNLVYDRHDIIYAYGPTDEWRQRLLQEGYGQDLKEIPVPHAHMFHEEFDESVAGLLADYQWHYSPLRDGDEI